MTPLTPSDLIDMVPWLITKLFLLTNSEYTSLRTKLSKSFLAHLMVSGSASSELVASRHKLRCRHSLVLRFKLANPSPAVLGQKPLNPLESCNYILSMMSDVCPDCPQMTDCHVLVCPLDLVQLFSSLWSILSPSLSSHVHFLVGVPKC
jgi:hypothetical protein